MSSSHFSLSFFVSAQGRDMKKIQQKLISHTTHNPVRQHNISFVVILNSWKTKNNKNKSSINIAFILDAGTMNRAQLYNMSKGITIET